MKLGRLLVASVVMAALGGFLWWSNKQEAAKEGQPEPGASPKILSINADNVREIEIKLRDEAPTIVKKAASGATWDLTAPKAMAADSGSVAGIVSTVASLASERVVDENPADLKGYGLDPAAATVTFTLTDGKKVLRIGDATPAGSSVYAMVDGDKRLYTMASSSKDSIAKSFGDLREKHLLNFEQEKLSRVELMPAGKPAMEFGRTGANEWQVLKPRPLRADGWQVEDLLTKMKSVMMEPAVDDKTAASGFASAKPVATIRITGPDGVKSIEIRKNKDDVYAKSSSMEGVYKVNKDAADGLDKSVDDFRAKKLFDFGFSDPSKVEVKDGAKMLVVEKSGEEWKSGGKTMDAISVQNLIDKLRDLSASHFVEGGYAQPSLELTVTSNEGKRVEKVLISGAGNAFIAKRENDPSLYQLEGDVVRDLRQSIDGVREPTPATKK